MSSLVAEVLQAAGKLAKEDVISKVNNLKRKVEDIKLELQESLKNRYIEFLPQYVKLDKLILNLTIASNEYEVLRSQIEEEVKPQMTSSVTEFHNVIEDLRKIRALKEVVADLAALHQHLEGANRFLFQRLYCNAAEEMTKFNCRFKVTDTVTTEDIDIYCALKREFYVSKVEMIYQLKKIWKQNVSISRTEDTRKQGFEISITLKKCSVEETIDLLASLELLNELKPTLKEFGKKFLSLVCQTLLSNKISIKTSNKNDSLDLNLSVINDTNPEPSEVFYNLDKIFKFLHSELFYLPSSRNDDAKTLMNELGDVLSDDFCSLIIEKCLNPSIPKHSQGLEGFNKEIESVTNFNNILLEMSFLSIEKNKLQHFIDGVDILPVDKMAQDFLTRSRDLMKESLHPTVSVGIEESFSPGKVSDLVEMTEIKSSLSKSTFAFPRCEVSVSTKSFIDLLQDIMKEAKNVGIAHSVRLYYIAHNICDLYSFVAPTYHKNEIETIPQQTAIFHNNCMFIAHNLLILGAQYESELRALFPMTFVDLVPQFRKLGVEPFLAQMRRQRKQLLELIQDRQAFKIDETTEDALVNKAEKSIRQCLCQLQLLKKVWSPVLPLEIYFKAIGTLLNTCLEEIILHILAMEDITAENAAQLDSIFVILLKESPDLFKISSVDKQNLVHNYVRRWFKFQELQLVLSCSMKEIVDRWASGKGPLASHFTADEIKHLIRALFQNTERRAASLAKIR